MSSSTLIDHDAVMRGFVGKRVRRVAILDELGNRAEHDVRARSCLATKPVPREQIIRRREVIGNDHKQIPIAGQTRFTSCATSKQANLVRPKFFNDSSKQVIDGANIEVL